MGTKIDVEIAEVDIQNAIAVGIAESFTSEKKDAMIRQVVRAHLTMKDDSGRFGDRDKTILDKAVGDMIRKESEEELGRVMETMKPKVCALVREVLGPQYQEVVFDKLKTALSNIRISNLSVSAVFED